MIFKWYLMTFLKKTTFSVGVDFQGSGSLELHGSSSRDYLYARVQEWKAEAERSILCLSFCFLFQLLSSIQKVCPKRGKVSTFLARFLVFGHLDRRFSDCWDCWLPNPIRFQSKSNPNPQIPKSQATCATSNISTGFEGEIAYRGLDPHRCAVPFPGVALARTFTAPRKGVNSNLGCRLMLAS